jgi:hypothetical protein
MVGWLVDGWLVGWLVDGWMLDCGLGMVDRLSVVTGRGGRKRKRRVIGYRLSVISGRGGRKSCRLSVVRCRLSVEEEEMRLMIDDF